MDGDYFKLTESIKNTLTSIGWCTSKFAESSGGDAIELIVNNPYGKGSIYLKCKKYDDEVEGYVETSCGKSNISWDSRLVSFEECIHDMLGEASLQEMSYIE